MFLSVSILPDGSSSFNVDNVRITKILGSGLFNSEIVQGMVFKRSVEGDITKQTKAKIAVYTCPVDIATTETKVGTMENQGILKCLFSVLIVYLAE